MRLMRASYIMNGVLGALLLGILGVWVVRRAQSHASVAPDFWTAHHITARREHLARLSLPDGAVVVVGDSLTERAEWRELLARDDVFNRGISGDTVAGVEARLDAVTGAKPKVVALMIGINDLEAGAAPVEVGEGIERLVVRVRQASPSTKVLVLSVLPMRDVGRGVGVPSDHVDDLDRRVAALCERHGATFVDLRPALVDEAGALAARFTLDGVHLTADGYTEWAKALKPHLP